MYGIWATPPFDLSPLVDYDRSGFSDSCGTDMHGPTRGNTVLFYLVGGLRLSRLWERMM